MRTAWDLRLLPVALTVWLCAVLTLVSGWAAGAWCGGACAVVFTAAWNLPAYPGADLRRDRWRSRERRRGTRARTTSSRRGWALTPGTTVHLPVPLFSAGVVRGTRPGGRRWTTVVVVPAVVLLAAAAAVLTALADTAPAREFLAVHSPGAVVRLQAEVSGAPSPYTAAPGPGEQEASHGVAVDLLVSAADGVPGDVALTVFASDPGWAALHDGERLDAVVTMTDTADAARLTARASTPPSSACTEDCESAPRGVLGSVREDLAQIADGYGAVSAGLVPGTTVGDTSRMPDALAQSMKDTGLTHLTAVSGSNCALVMTLTGYAALALRASRRGCLLAGLAALAGFVLLVGPDPSVLRAGVMGALGGLSMLSGRPGVSLNALCAAVTGLVLAAPTLAVDFGFVLSVLATAGIVVSARPVTRILSVRLPTALAVCLAVPLVAQLWCGPVLLLLNPTLPLYSLPANIAASPFVPVVTVAGLLAVCVLLVGRLLTPALHWLLPGTPDDAVFSAWERAASVPVGVASYPARTLGWIADTFAALPGAHVPWPGGVVGVLLLTALTLLALGGVHVLDHRMRRPRPIHGTARTDPAPRPESDAVWRARLSTRRFRRRALAATTALALVMLLVMGILWWLRPAPEWESVVCDVGQGDAVLHRTGEHSAVLVDGGPDPRALHRCLSDAGVTHLDAVVASHNHDDHVAGLDGLSDVVDVDRVWYSTAGDSLPDELAPLADKAVRPQPGERFTSGPLTMEVLAPTPPAPTPTAQSTGQKAHRSKAPSSDAENNASLLLLLTLTGHQGTTTWLTAGDLEADAYRTDTRTLPDHTAPHVDVLKVSHHGARNGGTDIIHDTHPALAVISVGADNSYGHPHPETVAALQEVGAAVARTDQSGALWIRKDGDRVVVSSR